MHPEYSHIRFNLLWRAWPGEPGGRRRWVCTCSAAPSNSAIRTTRTSISPYPYRLPRFQGFQEGSRVLVAAMKRFSANNDELYRAGFWLFHSLADWHRDRREYPGMIQALKGLCSFSAKRKLIYRDDMTFSISPSVKQTQRFSL